MIGTPFFIHMNVSGGDPDEVQVNVRGEPVSTFKTDDDGCVDIITGGAMYDNMNNVIIPYAHLL